MKRSFGIIGAVTLLTLAACTSSTTDTLSNREKTVALLNSLETGDPAPVAYINPSIYTQHNLEVADGVAGFGELMKSIPEGSVKVDVIRALQDGDYVFTHTKYDFFGPQAGFDIFRFENGMIVEHWDNLQGIIPTTVSGRTQFDGPTEITDLDKTQANKTLVKNMLDEIFLGGNTDKITDYISATSYAQHSPNFGDGLDGLGKGLTAMAKAGKPMVFEKVHMILGEGNFVLSVSEGQFLGKHCAFFDLFRIENNKVVEHWDTIQEIPPQSEWKNNNGKF